MPPKVELTLEENSAYYLKIDGIEIVEISFNPPISYTGKPQNPVCFYISGKNASILKASCSPTTAIIEVALPVPPTQKETS